MPSNFHPENAHPFPVTNPSAPESTAVDNTTRAAALSSGSDKAINGAGPYTLAAGGVTVKSGPAAPVITSPAESATVTTTPTVTGTAEKRNTVNVYVGGVTLVGTTTVKDDGTWSVTTSAIATGSRTLTAKQTNPNGTVSAASAGVAVTVA